ncbi:hypothetical protein G5I_14611 [Acromyrmex echinatior]|uniref:Uncharacterized protein n=1 Tax=Acromyrmex echinatior TaxID=103372 RepID=F4X8D2_ACREC|nr:hypothetical protein G5I_14611 [Acromyrmex echinatior]
MMLFDSKTVLNKTGKVLVKETHVVLGEKPPRDPFFHDTVGSSEESRAGGGDPGKLGVKKSRLKASSPNRQGPQQCQMSEIDCHSNFIQIGFSVTVVVRLLIYAYQEYLCNYQSEYPAATTPSIALYSSRPSFDKIFLRDADANLEQAEQTRRHPDVTHEGDTPPRIPRLSSVHSTDLGVPRSSGGGGDGDGSGGGSGGI